MQPRAKITGTGSYIPEITVKSDHFLKNEFFEPSGDRTPKEAQEVVAKFEEVAGIIERRYAGEEMTISEMGYIAASRAIEKADIDPETIDYIIFAHNWGNVSVAHNFYDIIPNLAARVKHELGIRTPRCVAYDILFGCPGWLQGVIQADCFIRAGNARRVLVIGSDAVSRTVDPHDRDSMLFGDGAGAIILEATEAGEDRGILHHAAVSDCGEELFYLTMNYSYNPAKKTEGLYLKMNGRNVFRYALAKIPPLVNESLNAAGVSLEEVKKMLIHQANKKMIEMIARKLFNSNGQDTFPQSMLPINVNYMGNNSVATIPILLDTIVEKKFPGHTISPGDVIVFASVGAGMHANCMIYRW